MTKVSLLLAAALAVTAPAFAQQPANPTSPAANPIGSRRDNQQDRIANGVQSGQLTAGETKNLESREANLNRQIHADRTDNGGKLTQQERQNINRRQNNISRSIYQDKHNSTQAHNGSNEVGQRRANQQARIAQGIRSGQMTAGEAARAEGRQQNINRHIAADRAANGGHLTQQERQNINRRQNGASRQIYRERHNGARSRR